LQNANCHLNSAFNFHVTALFFSYLLFVAVNGPPLADL